MSVERPEKIFLTWSRASPALILLCLSPHGILLCLPPFPPGLWRLSLPSLTYTPTPPAWAALLCPRGEGSMTCLLPPNPLFLLPRALFSCSISVLLHSTRGVRRSQIELRAGAHSQAAAWHHPARNYRDLPSYYCCDEYMGFVLSFSPVWKGGSHNTNKLGCNGGKNAFNKGSSQLRTLGFKFLVLLAAACVAFRKSLLHISPPPCSSGPGLDVSQGYCQDK